MLCRHLAQKDLCYRLNEERFAAILHAPQLKHVLKHGRVLSHTEQSEVVLAGLLGCTNTSFTGEWLSDIGRRLQKEWYTLS